MQKNRCWKQFCMTLWMFYSLKKHKKHTKNENKATLLFSFWRCSGIFKGRALKRVLGKREGLGERKPRLRSRGFSFLQNTLYKKNWKKNYFFKKKTFLEKNSFLRKKFFFKKKNFLGKNIFKKKNIFSVPHLATLSIYTKNIFWNRRNSRCEKEKKKKQGYSGIQMATSVRYIKDIKRKQKRRLLWITQKQQWWKTKKWIW